MVALRNDINMWFVLKIKKWRMKEAIEQCKNITSYDKFLVYSQ